MRQIRGRDIALVLQSPLASLNPALRIGTQMAEAWRAHHPESKLWTDSKLWKPRALELFERVSLPAEESFLDRYPRQLSVGQAQRVLIAMAVLHKPRLLIADEPTSALDAITQSEILDLFRSLNRELNMAMLFVSHDLLAVASLCSRIAILQRGKIVESGPTEQMFRDPHTDDTRALLQAVLRNSSAAGEFAAAAPTVRR
jgi:ABC-type dipeptide/oligopeptide/nickel transport system ATPase component